MPNIVALVAEYLPDSSRGRLLTWLFIAQAWGLDGRPDRAGFVDIAGRQLAFWVGGGVLLPRPAPAAFRPESSRFLMQRRPDDPHRHLVAPRGPGVRAAGGRISSPRSQVLSACSVTALFRDGRGNADDLMVAGHGHDTVRDPDHDRVAAELPCTCSPIPEADAARMMSFSRSARSPARFSLPGRCALDEHSARAGLSLCSVLGDDRDGGVERTNARLGLRCSTACWWSVRWRASMPPLRRAI